MLRGKRFVPAVIRVVGTYSLFAYYSMKLLGNRSLNIILMQSVAGILSGAFGYSIIRSLTGRRWLGIVGLLLICLRIRVLLYEHILLPESLYDFLGVVFIWCCVWIYSNARLLKVVALGIICALLFFARAQGIGFVGIGTLFVIATSLRNSHGFLRAARWIAVYLTPIIVATSFYVGLNKSYNHFSGISAGANYNLFWISTTRFIDFDSPQHRDIKDALRACIEGSNRRFTSDLSWSTVGPNCEHILPAVEKILFGTAGSNWNTANRIMGEISTEAMYTHPISFGYRFLWNVWDFLWMRGSLRAAIDLDQLLLDPASAHVRLSPVKAEYTKQMDSFRFYHFNKDYFDHSSSESVVSKSALWITDRLFEYVAIIRSSPFVVALFLFSVFVQICGPSSNRSISAVVIGLWLSQVVLTVFAATAVYDRYHLFPEACMFLMIVIALGSLLPMDWKARVWKCFSFLSYLRRRSLSSSCFAGFSLRLFRFLNAQFWGWRLKLPPSFRRRRFPAFPRLFSSPFCALRIFLLPDWLNTPSSWAGFRDRWFHGNHRAGSV